MSQSGNQLTYQQTEDSSPADYNNPFSQEFFVGLEELIF